MAPKQTAYEKELRRRIRKLKKQETWFLTLMKASNERLDESIEALEEMANKYDTDQMVKAEDVHSDIMSVLRFIQSMQQKEDK